MGTEFSAHALMWWLKGQDKFDGANVRTRQLEDGTWEVFEWNANGVPQPSEAEINTIIANYNARTKEEWEKTTEEKLADLTAEVEKLKKP